MDSTIPYYEWCTAMALLGACLLIRNIALVWRRFGASSIWRVVRLPLHCKSDLDTQELAGHIRNVLAKMRDQTPQDYGNVGEGNTGVIVTPRGIKRWAAMVSNVGFTNTRLFCIALKHESGKRYLGMRRRPNYGIIAFSGIIAVEMLLCHWYAVTAFLILIGTAYAAFDITGLTYVLATNIAKSLSDET